MERCLLSSTVSCLRICQLPRILLPYNLSFPRSCSTKHGFCTSFSTRAKTNGAFCTKATLSELGNKKVYSKIGADSTGSIPSSELLQVVEVAAKTGAQVVMDAVNKPRNVTYKGLTDLVTDTDKSSEVAILEVVRKNFPDHLILGEEGGIIGDSSSDYLWCIDPLDGTTNFAHGYPSFAVSVGVLFRGKPAAAAVVEQSLLVTGFGYDHDDPWATNIELFKEFTDVSRGVRRLGAAAVDMCHVALGIAEAYWEYRLKPWDMAAGVLIVEEAGGTASCMDGGRFSVFDRSVLVSNGLLHAKLLEKIGPAKENLKSKGIDCSVWFKPENYHTEV
ncbi:phosphatase IMPL1, chloroplastic-like isoform X2 [Lycium barbarum]|uniref:phosphatase IMPL1, chloroplastic-like isoform X2 n=1 Tax=Lycium barbarum TaxID=112863 RepID=UPI00293EA38F|nr:phosphatase IMPL1, chloroplastic-like isoform X2 [Lycium barbarum]